MTSTIGLRPAPDRQARDATWCLEWILRHQGRTIRAADLEHGTQLLMEEQGPLGIVSTARRLRCHARVVHISRDEIHSLALPAIVETTTGGFAVLTSCADKDYRFENADGSEVRAPLSDWDRHLTGTIVIVRPAESFVALPGKRTTLASFSFRMLAGSSLTGRVLMMSALVQVFGLLMPLLTGLVVQTILPRGDRRLLLIVGLTMPAILGFVTLAYLIRGRLLVALRTAIDIRLCVGFMNHLLDLPFEFFRSRSPGDLLGRVSSQQYIRDTLAAGLLSSTLDVLMATVYLIALVFCHWAMAAVTALFGVLQILALVAVRGTREQFWTSKSRALRRCQTLEHEIINGMETVMTCGLSTAVLNRWEALYVDLLNSQIRRWKHDAVLEAVFSALRIGGPLAVLTTGAVLVLDRQVSLGMMLSLLAIATSFLLPLSNAVTNIMNLQMVKPSLERVRDVLETPARDADPGRRASLRLRGAITLSGVRVEQGGYLLLDDINLDIRPGEFVAIVGRTGSGKSTLVRLLAGLYERERGKVMYDGVAIETLDLDCLRSQIGFVTQAPAVFSMSVGENIAMARPNSVQGEVEAAATMARVDGDIDCLPGKYEANLCDPRIFLSGGQKQRLAIARALVRNPAILVLDEATSAVDSITEAAIQRALDGLECTRVVVAHRLSTVRRADRIVVLEGGRIVETGTHVDLLKEGGRYAALIATQLERHQIA